MRFTEKKNLTAPLLLLAVCALTLLSRLVPYPEGNEIYLTVIVLNMLIFVLPAVFYARLQGQGYIRKMNLRPIGFSRLPVVLFLFFVLVSGSILLHYLLYVTGAISFGESESAGNFAFLAQTGGGASDVLLTALAFAVVPAAAEEFFFRGVFMSEYEDYGGVCQVVVSSIAFALVHFSASRLPGVPFLRLFPVAHRVYYKIGARLHAFAYSFQSFRHIRGTVYLGTDRPAEQYSIFPLYRGDGASAFPDAGHGRGRTAL